MSVYRGYDNACTSSGTENPRDSAHRFSTDHDDIAQLAAQFCWSDEGIAFCALP